MSIWNTLGHMLVGDIPPDETVLARAAYEYPNMEQQLDTIRNRGRDTYRAASVNDALGVPAIFGAVSLIANTVGSLSLEAYRKGVLLRQGGTPEPPRLIQRPNPFTTLRVFLRDTAFHLATRGEAWWWIAVRDPLDDQPLSLFPVKPWEIVVEPNDDNRLRPTIKWGDRIMANRDMVQITYLPDRTGLRGMGPLQMCDAAVSVAVEAQEWAANFFSGSVPSLIGTTEEMLSEDELKELDKQWLEKPNNLPRWLGAGVEMTPSPFDPGKAQLTESREFQNGDVARMFSMPGSLLEHSMSGQSLRYQNDETIWTDFQRRCLSPHYLEPIEQELSDLLTRSMATRFNLEQLLRADAKSRWEVYEKAVSVLGAEEAANLARLHEGLDPGSVDFAPVPSAAPQAIPSSLPPDRVLGRSALNDLHCPKCGKLLGRVGGAAEIRCPRCRTFALREPVAEMQARSMIDVLHASVAREPAPAPNVTVHPATVTFEEGAIRVAAPDMAPMTEMAAAITELAGRPSPPNEVTVHPAEVRIEQGAIRVEVPAPHVDVQPPAVTVESPNVTVNMPEPKPTRKRIGRDSKGNIATITEEPT